MAYSTAEGVLVAAIPDDCAPGGPGALVFPGAKHPDWGLADVPPASAFETPARAQPRRHAARPAAKKLELAVTRAGKVTVTVPGAGKVTVTAKRKSRTVAKLSKTAKAAGQGHVQAQGARQGDRHRRSRPKLTAKQDANTAGVAPA